MPGTFRAPIFPQQKSAATVLLCEQKLVRGESNKKHFDQWALGKYGWENKINIVKPSCYIIQVTTDVQIFELYWDR